MLRAAVERDGRDALHQYLLAGHALRVPGRQLRVCPVAANRPDSFRFTEPGIKAFAIHYARSNNTDALRTSTASYIGAGVISHTDRTGPPLWRQFPAASRSQIEEADDAVGSDFKDLFAVMTRNLREEAKRNEEDIIATIRAMGGCIQSYRKERRRAVKAMVSEVYSPPRFTAACKLFPKLKVIPAMLFS